MLQISFQYFQVRHSSMKQPKVEGESKPKARVNYSIDESNFAPKKDRPSIPKKLNNTGIYEKRSEKNATSNLDETLVYDESCKSPDISNICSEFFSPKTSQRDPDKVYLNQTQIKSQKMIEEEKESHHNLTANNYGNLNMEKILDTNEINQGIGSDFLFDVGKANDFLKKLKKKKQEMREKEKKLLKEQEDLRVIKESK